MSGSPFCPWSFMTKYKSEKHAFHLGKLLNNHRRPKDKDELMRILHNKTTLEIMQKTEEMSVIIFKMQLQRFKKNSKKFLYEILF